MVKNKNKRRFVSIVRSNREKERGNSPLVMRERKRKKEREMRKKKRGW